MSAEGWCISPISLIVRSWIGQTDLMSSRSTDTRMFNSETEWTSVSIEIHWHHTTAIKMNLYLQRGRLNTIVNHRSQYRLHNALNKKNRCYWEEQLFPHALQVNCRNQYKNISWHRWNLDIRRHIPEKRKKDALYHNNAVYIASSNAFYNTTTIFKTLNVWNISMRLILQVSGKLGVRTQSSATERQMCASN